MKEYKYARKALARQSLPVDTKFHEKKKKGSIAVVLPLPVRTNITGHFPVPVAGRFRVPNARVL